ncbi:class I SAM-dependent methyltransferase [Paracraurococcus lichenis]|uniref:Methyltransferase domain-containing protein n=1 Tax=Paracraurococcus lichenis TaxID=3064888 RepID=A0ABT9E4I8_9PROT|nr:class I SAM-dependent methyltransferase [Paracraurococcus sp. LOR1-02]MDO9710910.1 methyltransferase domain-containing protein [Paracraurococcus sp. LOR1-02]
MNTIDMKGTQQSTDALAGRGLLQSPEEWEARNTTLVHTICDLIETYKPANAQAALDVGAELGGLTDRFAVLTDMTWRAIDPDISEHAVSDQGVELFPSFGHDMPFEDQSFDCVTFINVFEHVSPEWRVPTMKEIKRVLRPGGILVGQLPNPYFPIESHSRLPLFGYVPTKLQPLYWRLTPTGWDFKKAHFFIVTINHMRRIAEELGFEIVLVQNFNYPVSAIPKAVRGLAALHSRLGVLPWAWQFVFRNP